MYNKRLSDTICSSFVKSELNELYEAAAVLLKLKSCSQNQAYGFVKFNQYYSGKKSMHFKHDMETNPHLEHVYFS